MLASLVCSLALALPQEVSAPPADRVFTDEDVAAAARVVGDAFSDEEIQLMLDDVADNLASFEELRGIHLENAVPPALFFRPEVLPGLSEAPELERRTEPVERTDSVPGRPDDLEELAFADVRTLHELLVTRTVSCVELTEMFLARLRSLDEKLACVITFTEERALERARMLDAELAEGHSRGLLHGIPWVAKDLLAVCGYRTTWGAKPFEDQVIDLDAAVVERLDAAGAVLIAKVTLGALAWGDVWFGGQTKNPWNPEQGSSGSSAGSAAAVAAGGAVFAIGSETLGSIVSPSHRCGNSSLRPTFGRVSRHGAMTLSWSMDKLGPLCRSAEDAAIVFSRIAGADPRDPATLLATTPSSPAAVLHDAARRDVNRLTVGFLPEAFEDSEEFEHVLIELEELGVTLVPVELPDYPVGEMVFVLSVEAAAAFDEFSRGPLDDQLVRQVKNAWPNVFRNARLIPAVDYLRANRLRTLLTRDYEALFEEVDVLVHPSYHGGILAATNLTGHPTFVAPCGFDGDEMPYSISFTAGLHGEAELLSVARAWQAATDHHLRHPDL